MFRYRIQFSKTGPARYISHLDLLKAFERALRRAGLPVAFSQGFNPHPKMGFAAPSPVGVAGEEEYMDIELTNDMKPESIKEILKPVLPGGLDVKKVRQVDKSAPSAMAQVNRAAYKVQLRLEKNLSTPEVNRKLEQFLSESDIFKEKRTKKGTIKQVNIRPGIYSLKAAVHESNIELEMELAIGSVSNVRPEDVISALEEQSNLGISSENINICRTGLFVGGETGIKSLWES